MGSLVFTGVRGLGPFRVFCDEIGDRAYRSILQRGRVPEALLEDIEAKIPLAKMFDLLDRASRVAGDPLFGLKLGAAINPADYGIWARYVTAAPTLGTLIQRARRAVSYYQPGASFSLDRVGSVAIWRYHCPLAIERSSQPHEDHIVWPMIRAARAACGPAWLPSWTEVTYRRPAHVSALEQALGVPVRFNTPALGLAFPASCLTQTTTARASLDQLVTFGDLRRIVHGAPPRTIAAYVRHVLHAILRAPSADLESVTIGDVALLMGRSTRSLQRELSEEGASFRAILSSVRIARAREMIAESDASLQDIAWHLGYSALPHFTRAFRMQLGVSPSHFRKTVPNGDC